MFIILYNQSRPHAILVTSCVVAMISGRGSCAAVRFRHSVIFGGWITAQHVDQGHIFLVLATGELWLQLGS